jgi:Phytanoyl-CoA dioxygenase (PhyH)
MMKASSLLLLVAASASAFTITTLPASTTTTHCSTTALSQSTMQQDIEATTTTAVSSPQHTPATSSSSPATTANAAAGTGKKKKKKVLEEPAMWEYNFGLQDPKLALPHGLRQDVSPPDTFAISEEQIQTLERDGVVLVKKVFDDAWVDYLRKATAYQVDHPHFWSFAGTASKLYDYIQRNVWQTNRSFANFYYHSALGDVLRQCGRTNEIRISTDLLMVNPNKGFKWHQDNQNGPITAEEGIRFWITMDETPKDYGAPVYLKGSHRNTAVDPQAVFVDIDQAGLEEYRNDWLEFRTQPGDMLIWHPKTIHKIDGPVDGIWTSFRRVLGGTAAKGGTRYHDKRGTGGVLSDLGRHGMQDGDKLDSPFFPIVYPHWNAKEAAERDAGRVGRSAVDIVSKVGGMATVASGEKFKSFFQVLGSRDAK